VQNPFKRDEYLFEQNLKTLYVNLIYTVYPSTKEYFGFEASKLIKVITFCKENIEKLDPILKTQLS